jgi:hypothetical protein
MRFSQQGLCIFAMVLAGPSNGSAQIAAGPLDSLRVDYADTDVTTFQVNQFLLCFDGAADTACLSVPLSAKFTPTAAQGGPPAPGESAYKRLLPALTAGAHTVVLKACNASICSNVDNLTLSFTFQIVPPAPKNAQFIKG